VLDCDGVGELVLLGGDELIEELLCRVVVVDDVFMLLCCYVVKVVCVVRQLLQGELLVCYGFVEFEYVGHQLSWCLWIL